jgi:hypothetical protein
MAGIWDIDASNPATGRLGFVHAGESVVLALEKLYIDWCSSCKT